MPTLAPHIFAVRSRSDLVLMDVRGDGYLLLVDAVSEAQDAPLLHPIGVPLVAEALEALRAADMIGDLPAGSNAAVTKPRSVLTTDRVGGRVDALKASVDLLLALAGAGRRMRLGLPCRNYRDRRSVGAGCLMAVLDASLALEAARLAIPTPRRCLPASLVTSLFLRRRGIASEIVFGVRTHPFAAHCWVEVGGVVVGDVLERVAAYTPICVADA